MNGYKVHNVLHVPHLMFSLLSVSKITKELLCAVIILPILYVFQGLFNVKIIGIGKEIDGLYIMQENKHMGIPIVGTSIVNSKTTEDGKI